jgi:inner membrane protein
MAQPSLAARIASSQLTRVLLLALLVLLLGIPLSMVEGVIGERAGTRLAAVSEVTQKWGQKQVLIGPQLVVPYTAELSGPGKDGAVAHWTELRHAHFLPQRLKIEGQVASEVRHRGIFDVPVYRLRVTLSGRFAAPDFGEWGVDAAKVLWDRAYLSLGISDAHSITDDIRADWQGAALDFQPGPGEADTKPGVHAPLGRRAAAAADFHLQAALNGSEALYFAPLGRDTQVRLTSDWPDPSFDGNWLPSDYRVTAAGFQASWRIPYLGRNYPQRWTSPQDLSDPIDHSAFGVALYTQVDQYRMAARSAKYGSLFLLLTFAALWLFEVLARVRTHPVQYLIVGAALVLFFLLELALSEHLGFDLAYLIASLAVLLTVVPYGTAVLGRPHRAAVLGLVLAALYGYLYVLLSNQDYALLVGAVALFLALGAVMYLTRNVDWHRPVGG